MTRRVVITGMAGICPLGDEWEKVSQGLREGRSAVQVDESLDAFEGMGTRLAARVTDFRAPGHWPRRKTRSMGRVALLAAAATERALESAGLTGSVALHDGTTGIAYGSTAGSPPAMEVYARRLQLERSVRGIRSTDYVQFMSHTVPANLAQFFEVRGRVIPTCSACTSGSQGIGYGYESVRFGREDLMIVGGAEEYHPIDVAVFDVLYATSKNGGSSVGTPRPFDVHRDGLVVGEGAATLILEELEHARRRGAPILAEVIGYGTNCDGRHITQPDREGMAQVMQLALDDAGLAASDVDYVNAHGTATEAGDIAESLATGAVFGSQTPVSTLKGHFGHTLGACGAIEAWLTLEMLREGWLAPTLNLEEVDPRCGRLDYVCGGPRRITGIHAMSNNFAFGGVNTSLLFRRPED